MGGTNNLGIVSYTMKIGYRKAAKPRTRRPHADDVLKMSNVQSVKLKINVIYIKFKSIWLQVHV